MKTTVTIDARLHDAVVFALDDVVTDIASTPASKDVAAEIDSMVSLARKLSEVGVVTAVYSSRPDCEQVLKAAGLDGLVAVLAAAPRLAAQPDPRVLPADTKKLGTTPERTVVVEATQTGVQAARNGGFALVIGVDRVGHAAELLRSGADVIVEDLAQVAVRQGDKRISELPNALDSYGQLIGVVAGRQPFVCLDFDGTLAEIVAEPDAAKLVDGAAKALESLAALCPVAILSGRDLADVRNRIAIPGIWYSGSHGFELIGPDGEHRRNDAAATAVPVLERAAADLREDLGRVEGVNVEHKRYAVAVHFRNVAPERVAEVVATTHRHGQRHGLRVTGGRKIVELRPDIDWDKGTALRWLGDQIHQTGRVLPIYIGDDLTDEDAFDAVRFSGIGIVVRHDEDGDRDRATAAQFTLNNPGEVEQFLRRGGDWLAYEQQTSDEAWTLTYDGYDPPSEKLREALCTVGNGYFATRGAAPESKADQVHYPGTYAAGVFNRLEDVISGTTTDHESLVNFPNWLPLTFRIDGGDWFDVDRVELLSYRQALDIRRAILTRELRFRDHAGRTTFVAQHRFVAMHQAHVAAMETTVTAEDWAGTIEVRSTLDGNVGNTMVERYRDLASTHLTSLKKSVLSPNSVLMTVDTTQSQIPIAVAARTTVWRDGQPAPATYRVVDGEFEIGH
jgi:trehalose-phosphatase